MFDTAIEFAMGFGYRYIQLAINRKNNVRFRELELFFQQHSLF
jgi:hypothetical protein